MEGTTFCGGLRPKPISKYPMPNISMFTLKKHVIIPTKAKILQTIRPIFLPKLSATRETTIKPIQVPANTREVTDPNFTLSSHTNGPNYVATLF